MTTISKPMLQAIRKDVDALLEALAPKFGLSKLKLANCTYSPTGSFTFKLDGQVAGGLPKEASRYNEFRKVEPLPPLDTEFTCQGDTFKVSGMNSTGSKVHAVRVGDEKPGRFYLFKVDAIQRFCRGKIDLSTYQEWQIPDLLKAEVPAPTRTPSLLQKQAG